MADELAIPQRGGISSPHCGLSGNGNTTTSGATCTTSLSVESVRKLLAPFIGFACTDASSNGDSNNPQQPICHHSDPELFAVPLRQMPVSRREVPKYLLRGEVMDWIVQHVDDAKFPHFLAWKIASICADNLYRDIATGSQQINALNNAAKRELEKVCREVDSNTALLEECLSGVSYGASPCSPSGISVKALRNVRRTMEDRHVIVPDLNAITPCLKLAPVRYEYYAVFDGHGGRDAANFGAAHLHLVLAEQLAQGYAPADAIKKAFSEIDKNFCGSPNESSRRSGSTAVVVLICDRRKLYVGWLGDSEAVLARAGTAEPLVIPHKASLQSEQTRIKKLGGNVHLIQGIYRVNGNLAVSRSIGDVDHKPYVSCDAEVNSVDLDSECDFIVLGCDGLFDSLTAQDIVIHTYHAALSLHFDTTCVADHLTEAAVTRGSTDNITTLVVNLRDPKKWRYEAVVFPSQATFATCLGVGQPSPGEQLTEQPADVSSQQTRLNGSTTDSKPSTAVYAAEVPNLASLTGGEASPVREVAADFVHSAVEMALNKVNNNNEGAPGGLELTSCDLSPPEGEQRDLIATLKNETPESERLNPEAPEFVPFSASLQPAENAPVPAADASDLATATSASLAITTAAMEAMSKSESRDELVYEIDRQLSTAPEPAKAELVEIEDCTAAAPPFAAPSDSSPIKAGEGAGIVNVEALGQLSDSEDELNSMVVHEDQPQTNIVPAVNMDVKLSELIVRDQNIHVIPEESPSDEIALPAPEMTVTSQASVAPSPVPEPRADTINIDDPTENLFTAPAPVDTHSPGSAEIQQQTDPVSSSIGQLRSNNQSKDGEMDKEGVSVVDASPAAVADISAQLIQGDLLNLIETCSAQPTMPCASEAVLPVTEPLVTPRSDYLFSLEGGVHEEVIIPSVQPLLYDDEQLQQPEQGAAESTTTAAAAGD
ncbi:uncharacterized protein LOC111269730, partial [Varroa jacobsoni]|uniref:uncharacterized protein LOC111269730 n=1 Tax=Varroa jacobsoni TaxID=62625 RepID=UPI000BF677C4